MRPKGFTISELLVAVMVSGLLISVTVSTYSLFRRSITADQLRSDISQNARVALDRLARELRQTPEIITEIPADESDTSVPQPGEIEFEDGNQINSTDDLTYRRFYLQNRTLKFEVKECFFPGQTVRVRWNAVNGAGMSPTCAVIANSARDVANNVESLHFYGNKPLKIIIVTSDGALQSYKLQTSVSSRNL